MLSKGFFLVSSFWVGLHGNAPQDWVGLDYVQLNGDGLLDDNDPLDDEDPPDNGDRENLLDDHQEVLPDGDEDGWVYMEMPPRDWLGLHEVQLNDDALETDGKVLLDDECAGVLEGDADCKFPLYNEGTDAFLDNND